MEQINDLKKSFERWKERRVIRKFRKELAIWSFDISRYSNKEIKTKIIEMAENFQYIGLDSNEVVKHITQLIKKDNEKQE